MKSLKIAAAILIFSFIAVGDKCLAETVTPNDLAGTGWEGQLNAHGIQQSIRIGFSRSLPAGRLLYFHKITSSGIIGEGLNVADAPCQFTPRALTINSQNSDSIAQISVYSCAENPQEEAALENEENRKARAEINVTELSLTRNGDKTSLIIKAEIIGNTVTYELEQQDNLDSQIFENLDSLRNWVTGP